jgi:hypothetical protein
MKLAEIKLKAKKMGIDPGKLKKDELIKSIQIKEGNNPCFKANSSYCGESKCLWRDDCLTTR